MLCKGSVRPENICRGNAGDPSLCALISEQFQQFSYHCLHCFYSFFSFVSSIEMIKILLTSVVIIISLGYVLCPPKRGEVKFKPQEKAMILWNYGRLREQHCELKKHYDYLRSQGESSVECPPRSTVELWKKTFLERQLEGA